MKTTLIVMVVSGFKKAISTATAQENCLIISGKRTSEEDNKTYIYREIGISEFEHKFQLVNFMKLVGIPL